MAILCFVRFLKLSDSHQTLALYWFCVSEAAHADGYFITNPFFPVELSVDGCLRKANEDDLSASTWWALHRAIYGMRFSSGASVLSG